LTVAGAMVTPLQQIQAEQLRVRELTFATEQDLNVSSLVEESAVCISLTKQPK